MLRKTVLAVCLFALTPWFHSLAQQKKEVTGEWDGTIAGKLRIIVRLEPGADKALHGSLESVDQGHLKIDVDEMSIDGTKVQLEMKKIGASYNAELSADGSELVGTWQQGGARVPLTLRRPGAVRAELKPTVRGRISLNPCPAGDGQGLCGSYEVYENRVTKTGRKIALHILILPALAEKPAADAVFGFGGGPGQAASEAYPFATFVAALRKQRDIVLIDQRGTGQSNPLRCAYDESSIQALLSGPSFVKDLDACRKELDTKADLTQYTTSIAADDADEVRDALGYEKIDLLGGSYGTLAALVYLRQHGDHVRSGVLEGVAPPDYRLPLPFAKTIQSALDHLFADCAADAKCHANFPNLKSEFETVVKRLDAAPATFEFPGADGKPQTVTLSRGAFVSGLRPMLYQPAIVSRLPYILHRAFENDFKLYTTAENAMRRAVNQSIARGLAFSVDCSDAVPFITEGDIARETAGTYLGDFDVRTHEKICDAWPHAKVSRDFLDPVRSDAPMLLISGEEDPATPPWLAQHAAEKLTHASVVAIPKGTHLTGAECIDHMIEQFVAQGSMSGIDTGCVNEVRNPAFFAPGPAK